MPQKVLVFGTFDGLDEGHRYFLAEAAKRGALFVSVARDAHVRELKQKSPLHPEEQRLAAVRDIQGVIDARLSDEVLGRYKLVEEIGPDVIVLGFDQQALRADLERWLENRETSIPIEYVEAYE